MTHRRAILLALCVLSIGAPGRARSVDSTTPGTIDIESSFDAIGFRWAIEGDDDLDCRVAVSFRASGAGGPWIEAQDLLRVEPGSYNNYGIDPGNLLAGSIFDLASDTSYDVRLELNDPDGGSAIETRSVLTRAVPQDPPAPRVRYVIPGHGGGSGTDGDPFRGIATADAAALPGDIFILEDGVYAGRTVLTASGTENNPIVWRGADREAVILDGERLARHVVRVEFTRDVHIENMTIRRPFQIAVSCTVTVGVVVRGCTIDVSEPTGADDTAGIWLTGPEQSNATIEGNTIHGPLRWEDGRNDDAYGVIVAGVGHVIRFNEIHGWYDGIEVGDSNPGIVTMGCDVHGNEIYDCTDDGIETDASRHNIRVHDNRITNCLCGLSCQPIFGGPTYFVRNVVYNWQLKPLKFHEWPTGMVVYNNTFVGADPRGWGGGQWRRAILRNNIFIGGSHPAQTGDPIAIETIGVRGDLDFDGWYQALPQRFAQYGDNFYPTLEDFRIGTGMETNGRLVDLGIFVDAEEPPLGSYLGQDGFPPPYGPGSQDLRLQPQSAAIDAGVNLANITDGCVGATPDLGAYEFGSATPTYGPAGLHPAQVEPVELPATRRLSVWPNPAGDGVTILIPGSGAAPSRVSIFDSAGRFVRTLSAHASGASLMRAVSWDARDRHGAPVAAGTYLCRVDGRAPRSGVKITIVR
jgi:hypothetical protein